MLLGPLLRRLLKLLEVRLVDLGNVGGKRVVGVGLGEEGEQGQQDIADLVGRLPRVRLQHLHAYVALSVHIWVVDLGGEGHLGGLEGVIRGEDQIQVELASLVRRFGRAIEGGIPLQQVITLRASADVLKRCVVEVLQFLSEERKRKKSKNNHLFRRL